MDENSNIFVLEVEREPFLYLLNECRKAEKFIDVKLKIDDKLFPAHRNVLSLYSPVLKAMLSDQWSTTTICPISEDYVEVEITEDLLNIFYTGSIKLTPDNVHPVCMAAHFLQIPTLLEPSVEYLCQLINVENVLTLFNFSTACELEELNYSCLRFVNNNHRNVFEVPQILELSFNELKNLIVGLQKFRAKMLRENTFHCIVRWTEKYLSERLDELPVLLKTIPLEELPLKFLNKTVSTHPLVKDAISGIKTVRTALANYRTYSTNPPWKANQNMVVLDGTVTTSAVSLYDSRSGVWRKLPDIPLKVSHFGVTVVNHQDIILCGGFISYSPAVMTASVLMFEWSTQTWSELPEMPLPCANTSAVICNDHLYVVGRYQMKSEDPALEKRVLRYSFETRKWSFVASTNEKRGCGSLIEHKNCLYVFGGYSKTIEKYDPARDKWTIMTKMLCEKSHINDIYVDTATLHQDKFYFYGLDPYCDDFEVYDPETNSLEVFPKPPFDIGIPSLVSLNGKLLAVGSISKGTSDLIYEFHFPTGKWIEFDRRPIPSTYPFTVVGAFH